MKEEDISIPPRGLRSKVKENDFSSKDINSSDSEDKLCDKDDGSGKGVNGANSENMEARIAYLD